MTREEAIEVLENGEWWEELSEWYMVVHPEHDKLHDAVDMAISALRQQETVENHNELMTLDDAIAHLDDTLSDTGRKWSCESCKQEHVQLRAWLAELREIKQERNVPLTLEDLRKMVGKWIWWDVDYGGYCRCENGYVVSKSGTYSFEWVSTHGKAYRQKLEDDAYVRT